MFKAMNFYNQIAYIAVLVGGILWGLAGIFNIYLITGIFGYFIGRIIYIAVGVAAGWLIYQLYLEMFPKKPTV